MLIGRKRPASRTQPARVTAPARRPRASPGDELGHIHGGADERSLGVPETHLHHQVEIGFTVAPLGRGGDSQGPDEVEGLLQVGVPRPRVGGAADQAGIDLHLGERDGGQPLRRRPPGAEVVEGEAEPLHPKPGQDVERDRRRAREQVVVDLARQLGRFGSGGTHRVGQAVSQTDFAERGGAHIESDHDANARGPTLAHRDAGVVQPGLDVAVENAGLGQHRKERRWRDPSLAGVDRLPHRLGAADAKVGQVDPGLEDRRHLSLGQGGDDLGRRDRDLGAGGRPGGLAAIRREQLRQAPRGDGLLDGAQHLDPVGLADDLHRVEDLAVEPAGDHHRAGQSPLADPPDELDAVHPRHVDVADDDVRQGRAGEDLQRGRPVGRLRHASPHRGRGAGARRCAAGSRGPRSRAPRGPREPSGPRAARLGGEPPSEPAAEGLRRASPPAGQLPSPARAPRRAPRPGRSGNAHRP